MSRFRFPRPPALPVGRGTALLAISAAALGLLAALGLPAAPALAAPSGSRSAAPGSAVPGSAASGSVAPDSAASGSAPAVSWQIQPSTRTGPTTRPYFVYDLAAKAAISDYVGVTNLGTTPLTVNVYPTDAYNAADGSFDVRSAAERPVDVGAWVALVQRTVTIEPRTRVDIPFTLTVPANATPGDHAGGIVASVTSTTTDSTGARVNVERRVGSRIYLRVGGAVRAGLSVTGLRTTFSPSANPFGPGTATLSYTVANTGNVRLAAHQQVRVSGPFGLLSHNRDPQDLPELLPGASVRRTVTVPAAAAVRLTAQVLLSPYEAADPATTSTAGASAPAPAGTPALPVRVRQGLWALAWWHAVIGLLLLAVLVWVARVVLRRYRRRTPPAVDAGPVRSKAPAPASTR